MLLPISRAACWIILRPIHGFPLRLQCYKVLYRGAAKANMDRELEPEMHYEYMRHDMFNRSLCLASINVSSIVQGQSASSLMLIRA